MKLVHEVKMEVDSRDEARHAGQSELDMVAEHRAESKFFIHEVMLHPL